MLPVRVIGSIIPLPALFATRSIEAGEELSWDYADGGGESWLYKRSPPISDLGGDMAGRSVCKCGSSA